MDYSYNEKTSRYRLGGKSEISDSGSIQYWARVKIPSDPTDTVFIIDDLHHMNPHMTATVFLGDSRWWWVICQMNGVINIPNEYQMGLVIRIPTRQRLQDVISRQIPK